MSTPIYRVNKPSTNPIEVTGKHIWEALFLASVQFKDSMSEDYIRLFGMPTVGDSSIDREMHTQPIYTFMTIDKMVEYFRRGIAVSIQNHSDTKRIYEIISNYINAWKHHLDRGINIGGAPIEDLILLDRFASTVFEHAVQHITPEYLKSDALKDLSGGGMWKGRDSFVPAETKSADEHVNFQKHESLAQLFSERIISSRGNKWK